MRASRPGAKSRAERCTMFTRDQKIEMQRQAWAARLRGVPQYQIAADLGVSQGFVSVLLKRCRTEMVAQNRLDAGTATGEQVARLDRMIEALTPQAEAGDVKAVQALLAVEDRRAKLLGLDAATRKAVDVTSGGAPLAYQVTIPTVQRIEPVAAGQATFGDAAPPAGAAAGAEDADDEFGL
jgi:predicted transcriptional regulator